MRKAILSAALCAAVLAPATIARAYINPNFTPVHLTERAECILLLKVKPADDKGLCRAEVVRTLKNGKDQPKPRGVQALDLTRSANVEHARAVREAIAANGDGPALLFVGKGENQEPISKLHLAGKWVSLDSGEAPDTWEIDVIDSHMEGTWAGGTDMLLRVTDLLLKVPDTDVPVACGNSWEAPVTLGRIAGRSRGAMVVDLAGRGAPSLLIISDGGDRLFAHDAKLGKFADVTAKLKLGSKSAVAAWGDFNGDGLPDLASSDGKALTLWSQAADGTFASAAVADAPKDECVGLAAVDAGIKGRAGLVWSGRTSAVLLVPDKEKAGVFAAKPLAAAAGALKDPTGPGASLVADFDGDAIADIIEPFAKGSVFFKGKGGGEFAEGAGCAVALGDGRTGAFLGDFDADGRMDVFTTAEDSPRLWQNAGGGRFTNLFHLCGELSYISKPGCIGGNACDFNNDGRQDAFLLYPEMAAQVFFSRGFRSFGHAHKPVDLAETGNLPEAEKGAQTGVLADLDGDGAQDMALVLTDGAVVLLRQAPADDAALALRVAVAPGASAGPVAVSASTPQRPLGVWTVAPGGDGAFFGLPGAGEVTLTWRLPGGEPQKKTVSVDGKSVRIAIDK